MKTWKLFAVLALVFVLGMAAGGLLTARIVQKRVQHVLAGGPDAVAEVIVRRACRQLRLDDTQRAQLHTVIVDAQRDVRAIRKTVQPQIQEVFSRAEVDIRKILRPDQLPRLDKILATEKARWKAFEPGP